MSPMDLEIVLFVDLKKICPRRSDVQLLSRFSDLAAL